MNVVLISTYELGRQPFGLASPAAWLRRSGAAVTCLDLSREPLLPEPVVAADLIAFYVPMHTATRLAADVLPAVRRLNPRAHVCCYGLYAPMNEKFLRKLGAETILGGEFEEGLVSTLARVRRSQSWVEGSPGSEPGRAQPEPTISLARQRFFTPDRTGLLPLSRYARLTLPNGERRIVGYTEASRGCKHLCRHCPIVPVYAGQFRIVQQDVVLADIRQLVEAGAEHITFGDPDFFNGPRHALELVRAFHQEHPNLTYDVTIKIEHLLRHAGHLGTLGDTGCLFVTSAVESVDNHVLDLLEKGHTFEDFQAVVELCREVGLVLAPTFVPFTPWTSLKGYCELLERIVELDLVGQVAPIQLAIRLLIPAGSRLLELREVRDRVQPFDEKAMVYSWHHDDPRVDKLGTEIRQLVERGEKKGDSRRAIFSQIRARARETAGLAHFEVPQPDVFVSQAAIPYLNEPWYC